MKAAAKKLGRATAKKTTPKVTAPYEPTPREKAAVDAFYARQRERKPMPGMKHTDAKGVATWSVKHPDPKIGGPLILESLGLTTGAAHSALVTQIINTALKGKDVSEDAANNMLAMVQEIEPRDAVEAMLATQMVAVHYATMTFARRLNHVENIPQQDSASNAFNKLARTFAAQVEALNRHRGKGQQQMTVTHMHVHDGGQAIVAANVQGGGASTKTETRPDAKAITHAPVPTMPSANAEREAVPVPARERPAALQDARRR